MTDSKKEKNVIYLIGFPNCQNIFDIIQKFLRKIKFPINECCIECQMDTMFEKPDKRSNFMRVGVKMKFFSNEYLKKLIQLLTGDSIISKNSIKCYGVIYRIHYLTHEAYLVYERANQLKNDDQIKSVFLVCDNLVGIELYGKELLVGDNIYEFNSSLSNYAPFLKNTTKNEDHDGDDDNDGGTIDKGKNPKTHKNVDFVHELLPLVFSIRSSNIDENEPSSHVVNTHSNRNNLTSNPNPQSHSNSNSHSYSHLQSLSHSHPPHPHIHSHPHSHIHSHTRSHSPPPIPMELMNFIREQSSEQSFLQIATARDEVVNHRRNQRGRNATTSPQILCPILRFHPATNGN